MDANVLELNRPVDTDDQAPAYPKGPGIPGAAKVDAIINLKLIHPDITQSEIAMRVKVYQPHVSAVLCSDYAKHAISGHSRSIRSVITGKLREGVFESVNYVVKLIRRGSNELNKDIKRPNPAIIQASTRAAINTLQGTGVFQEHQTITDNRLDTAQMASILDRAEQLKARLKAQISPNPVAISAQITTNSAPIKEQITPEPTGNKEIRTDEPKVGGVPARDHIPSDSPAHDTDAETGFPDNSEPQTSITSEPLVSEPVTPSHKDNAFSQPVAGERVNYFDRD